MGSDDGNLLARLFSRGLTNLSNSISVIAFTTSDPVMVFLKIMIAFNTRSFSICIYLLDFWATELALDVA